MATYTKNYNLVKPAQEDFYNVDDFNNNADKIDEALGNKVDKVEGKGLSTEDFTTEHKNALQNLSQGSISKSIFTAANQFLVSSGVGQVVAKTIAEIKSLLGLGSAAYKDTGSGNGLDADTVDGCHADTDYNGTAYQLARYNSAGKVHNSDMVDGYHFRVNGNVLEYSINGSTWIGVDEAMIQPTKPRQGFIDLVEYNTSTYYTVVDVTGKGILSDIVFSSIYANNEYMYIRITVDGASHVIHPNETVTASGAPLTSVSGSSTSSYGGSSRALKWSGLMYFNNSLKVEFRCASTSGSYTPKISGVVSYALI